MLVFRPAAPEATLCAASQKIHAHAPSIKNTGYYSGCNIRKPTDICHYDLSQKEKMYYIYITLHLVILQNLCFSRIKFG